MCVQGIDELPSGERVGYNNMIYHEHEVRMRPFGVWRGIFAFFSVLVTLSGERCWCQWAVVVVAGGRGPT